MKLATYEIRYAKRPPEKTDPQPKHYIMFFAKNDLQASWELSKVRRKPFYKRRETWLAKIPTGEEVVE